MKTKLKNIVNFVYNKPPLMALSIAVVMNFILEILSRRSLFSTVEYISKSPMAFLCSTLIITLTLALGLFFKRKMFVFAIISAAWLTLGVTNCVLLGYRTTPLSNVDFKIVTTALNMVMVYLSFSQIVLISILIVATIIFIILLWRKAPKQRIALSSSVAVIALLLLSTMLTTSIGINARTTPEDFINLAEAYDDYGFVYCFSRTIFDNGINMPENYSEEMINDITSSLNYNETEPDLLPNIIVIQLESFFDVNYLKDKFYIDETNPIPNFTRLRDEYPSGFMMVPSVGSGTAYTEFEVLTGINVDYFGPGECPYYTVVKNDTCDSVPYALAKYNYTSHAIHNNTGTFYERNRVYPNLGFNTFTPLEHMYNVEYTEYGWAKDFILTDSIMDCLNSTDGHDFIFTVSVQPHGKYPDDTKTSAYNYYIEQLKDVDEFIGQITEMLSQSDEPTMLILYGDHLPAIDLSEDDIINDNLHQTEYIIWSNYEIESIADENINAYELTAKVFGIIDVEPGLIIKARQAKLDDLDVLALSYDMLYGENYSETQKTMTDMKIGIKDITINGVYQIGNSIHIRGENFNEYSVAYINGSDKETVCIDDKTLIISNKKINNCDIVFVGQISTNNVILSETNYYIYNIKEE